MTINETINVNECVNKLMEISIEDIKNIEKYEQIVELYKDISKSKVNTNTTQSLQSIWEESLKQPSFQETVMPKELINDFQGISGAISKGQS